MPFDPRFKPGDPGCDNRLGKDRIGYPSYKPSWEVIVNFAEQLDPQDPTYPHYAEVHDNEDFATLTFNIFESLRAGVQWGIPGSYGPIPTHIGRHLVRLVLLNTNKAPLQSQSGDYYIDPGGGL
jgi:hypothetical protein